MLRKRAGDPPRSAALAPLREVADLAMRLHRPWAAGMVILAIVSVLHVTVQSGAPDSIEVRVTALTAVFMAMIWLPALVQGLLVAGGSVKTPAGEATTRGLVEVLGGLNDQTKRDTLPAILAALTTPEAVVGADDPGAVRTMRRELGLQYASAVPLDGRDVRETLDAYAQEYERLRRATPPSHERTRRMTTITAEARALARRTPLTTSDVRDMLQNGGAGERVIALGLAQDQPDPRLLELISDAIVESRSAFEQYQALSAAYELVAELSPSQLRMLRETLEQALRDPERSISEDASRHRLVQAILAEMEVGDSEVLRTE